MKLAILSDIHYAGPGERLRADYPVSHITSRLERATVNLYRRYIWQRDPFAHNHLLAEFISRCHDSDLVVANGDYSCDSGAVGVSDDAACESALECLTRLRNAFPQRFEATYGDHEIGKKAMGGNKGAMKLASFYRAQTELQLKPFWQRKFGQLTLIGITSTLLAFPVCASEAAENEWDEWQRLREQHLRELRSAFGTLKQNERVLLFCHDPTALPFLWRDETIRPRLGQIERTIIGHLHSRLVLFKSRLLAGMPAISFLGHTCHRLSSALREARYWKPFKVLLCPSLAGTELLKDGGFYTCQFEPGDPTPLRFDLQRFAAAKADLSGTPASLTDKAQ